MVTRRLRSEYMKKFKDPKWETYTKCYEETLKYRLSRRLLEQTHKPWFWSGSDTDSDSGGRSPLPPPSHQAGAEPRGALGGQGMGPDGPVPGLPLQEEAGEIRVSAPRVGMEGKDGAGGTEGQEEAGAKQAGMPQSPKEPGNPRNETVCVDGIPPLRSLTFCLFSLQRKKPVSPNSEKPPGPPGAAAGPAGPRRSRGARTASRGDPPSLCTPQGRRTPARRGGRPTTSAPRPPPTRLDPRRHHRGGHVTLQLGTPLLLLLFLLPC